MREIKLVKISNISDLNDVFQGWTTFFYSKNKLTSVMNKVDALTITYALATVADKVNL